MVKDKKMLYIIIGTLIIVALVIFQKPKELIPGEDCSETDESLDKFNVGITTNKTHSETDYCQPDLGNYLYEFACSENKIIAQRINCKMSNAFCYEGECVLFNLDTDGDGLTDYEELTPGFDRKVTDPNKKEVE